MKNLLALGLGLLGIGCALETGAPDEMENVDGATAAVVTRAKTISFLPARICDAIKSDVDSWDWSCWSDFRHTNACTEGWKAGIGKVAPKRKYVGSGSSIYFTPGSSSWHDVDDELFVANVESISCYNLGKSNEYPLVHFNEGLGPGKKVLSVETIFEHIRAVTVKGTVDIAFRNWSDPAYNDAVELVVQTVNSKGAWVDRAVRGSDYAFFNNDTNRWDGEPAQTLTVSAKVPANEPVRLLMRTGDGATKGNDVQVSLKDAELRGEECVPNNSGGCL
jgi:hypothetical protein